MNGDALIQLGIGIAIGTLASHATLGRQLERCMTQITDMARRLAVLERAPIHVHRRATDVESSEDE